MLRKTDCPVKRGTLIWRGFWTGFGVVKDLGHAVESEDELVVPVRYSNGQYGIISVTTRRRYNGTEQYVSREIRPHSDEGSDAIRYSQGMPDVLELLADSYKIGITDGDEDEFLYVRRNKDSIISESVMLAPR